MCVCVCVCICVCQTDVVYRSQEHKPKSKLLLKIAANQDGLVALSAVDSALFTLRPNYKDPLSTVTQRDMIMTDITWSW